MTVAAVKAKLNTHTGSSVETMVLQLKDESGRLVAALDDDGRKLGYYSPHDGCACAGWLCAFCVFCRGKVGQATACVCMHTK